MKNIKNKIINLVIIVTLVLGIYFYLFNKYGIGIPCVFHVLTGYYCPGCGMTRAILSIIKLDFYQAIRYNALSPMLLALGILYLINFIQNSFFKKKKELVINKQIILCFLIITLIYGVLRNIPYFVWLAPTII